MTFLRGSNIEKFSHGFALGFYTTLASVMAIIMYMICYYRKHVDEFVEPFVYMWQELKPLKEFTEDDNQHYAL